MKNKILKKALCFVFALLFWLFLWHFFAQKMDSALVLPSPWAVLQRLFELLKTFEFYRVLGLSFLRIMWGFSIGTVLGFTLGFCAATLSPIRILCEPIMNVLRATPIVSFILVVLFWTDLDSVPGIISLFMVLPIIFQSTLTGFQNRDKTLEEVKKVFRLSPIHGFFKVDMPQVIPYLCSAGKVSLGLAWKAGVAAEVLALPKVSVGYMIYHAKMYLETVDLYSWTLAIIIFSILLEKLLEKAFENRRWQGALYQKSHKEI